MRSSHRPRPFYGQYFARSLVARSPACWTSSGASTFADCELSFDPACSAAKIRCLNRCMSRSTERQLTASHSKGTSSGPFTAADPGPAKAASQSSTVSNVPFRSSVSHR